MYVDMYIRLFQKSAAFPDENIKCRGQIRGIFVTYVLRTPNPQACICPLNQAIPYSQTGYILFLGRTAPMPPLSPKRTVNHLGAETPVSLTALTFAMSGLLSL
jgi:hypothetical protein